MSCIDTDSLSDFFAGSSTEALLDQLEDHCEEAMGGRASDRSMRCQREDAVVGAAADEEEGGKAVAEERRCISTVCLMMTLHPHPHGWRSFFSDSKNEPKC